MLDALLLVVCVQLTAELTDVQLTVQQLQVHRDGFLVSANLLLDECASFELLELLASLQAFLQRVDILLDRVRDYSYHLLGSQLASKPDVHAQDLQPLLTLRRFLPVQRVVLDGLLDFVGLELDEF